MLDYSNLADIYKPETINVLLIGEAPPPNGESYFYKIPDKYSLKKTSIENDTSLPATIFNHYFGKRPIDKAEYIFFLNILKENNIFLIDILNEPIKIRERYKLNSENIEKLISDENLSKLQERIDYLKNEKTQVIFLLARNNYLKALRRKFPYASFINWKCFRLDLHEVIII
jgi:hypothetical protein